MLVRIAVRTMEYLLQLAPLSEHKKQDGSSVEHFDWVLVKAISGTIMGICSKLDTEYPESK